jgi:hypothetical protein
MPFGASFQQQASTPEPLQAKGDGTDCANKMGKEGVRRSVGSVRRSFILLFVMKFMRGLELQMRGCLD